MKNSNFIAKYIQGDRQQPKQRLQFPIAAQQRKHFEYAPREQLKISHDNNEFFLKDARRDNNLDVSNIEGAKPRISVRTRS